MPQQLTSVTQASLKQHILAWRQSPVLFVQQVFGAEPEAWQCDGLESFRLNDRTVLRASKGPGKSCCLAWCTLWFLTCFENSQIFLASVTASNLKTGLSKEVRFWYSQAPQWFQEFFTVTKQRIEDKSSPNTHFAENITWSKDADAEQQAESMTGKHGDAICWVLDEIGTWPMSAIMAADAIFSGTGMARIIAAGNCNTTVGGMWKVSEDEKEKLRWNCIAITGDPEDPKRSKRVSLEWAKGLIDTFGRQHPYVQINILGQFPSVALTTLLSMQEIRASSEREIDEGTATLFTPAIGIDVARQGADSTVIVGRQGAKGFPALRLPQTSFRGRDVVTALHQYIRENWHEAAKVNVYVDSTGGFGSSLMDIMHESGEKARGVHFHERADDPNSYSNKRAEMYSRLRDWFRTKGKMPWDDGLSEELSNMEYFYSGGGSRMQIESKELIRDKIGRSPDVSDSLALTFTEKDSMLERPKRREKTASADYDPLENSRIGMG